MVDGIVFDVELIDAKSFGQIVGAHKRSVADLEANGGFAINRQKFPVSPHAFGSSGNGVFAETLSDGVVVIRTFQRTKVILADVNRLFGVTFAALAAFEGDEKGIFADLGFDFRDGLLR